jgi:lipocalin
MTFKALLLSVALLVAVSANGYGSNGYDSSDTSDTSDGYQSGGVSPANYQAVKKFDASKLIGTQWYEAFFADNSIQELTACTRYVFTSASKNQITYQYGYYQPGLNGDFLSSTLTIKQSGNTGTFAVTTKKQNGQLLILDFASDYSWIVIADTNTNFLSVLSKTAQNLDGLQRALDLASKYGQDSHHLELQVTQCPYTKIFSALTKARK